MPPTARNSWLLPSLVPVLAAFALVFLFAHGASCGHDFSFHLQSGLEAARDFRHGSLDPAWAVSPAFNAGEPRFIFYPPLSWTLGGVLTLLLPFAAVPALFTWMVLTSAGLSMFFVLRRWVSQAAAFVAAALYLANPYMLFTALERTAFAELLATAILPWLLAAALDEKPRWNRIAIPLALLWLTNAPAAVMGSYSLLLLATVRLIQALRVRRPIALIVWNFIVGAAFGLALPAFYLLPAAYERRFVQIAMATIPGLSVPNNFLWSSTSDAGHDFVNHQASHIAVVLLLFVATICALLWRQRKENARSHPILPACSALAIAIALLLFRPSQFVWMHLPELAFLQFPWRWLSVLAAVAAILLGLLLRHIPLRFALPLAVTSVALLGLTMGRHFVYGCAAEEKPQTVAELFRSSHGVAATDEYTPGVADNDVLRFDLPAFWLTADPQAAAPGSIANPSEKQPDVDFGAPPQWETLSTPAPQTFSITTPREEFLVLHLRDYPNWNVRLRCAACSQFTTPTHIERDDGLIAIPVPAGASSIEILWRTGRDRELGAAVSLLALALFVICIRRSHRIVH